jgi:hypothetical protein
MTTIHHAVEAKLDKILKSKQPIALLMDWVLVVLSVHLGNGISDKMVTAMHELREARGDDEKRGLIARHQVKRAITHAAYDMEGVFDDRLVLPDQPVIKSAALFH